MATESAGNLRQCLTDLARADTTFDYDQALKAANRMIRRFQNETIAHKCKLVALIQMNQFDDALALIKKTPEKTMGDISFEKAYVLYRMNDNDSALQSLCDCASGDVRAMELKAQIYYKLENFQESYDLFRTLLRFHSDEYDEERKANILAVQAQLQSLGVDQSVDANSLETFEQLYNAACQEIENDELDLALQHLDKALEIGFASLAEDGRSDEDIEDELAMIRVQRAFVLHKQGHKEQALEIYLQVQQAGPSDVSVRATVVNNIPGASRDFNLADSRKKLKQALMIDQNKLTNRQKRTLQINHALVLLLSNQREPCRRALEELSKKFGNLPDTKLVEAVLLLKNDPDAAAKILEGGDSHQELTRVHILLKGGKLDQALAVLQTLPASFRNKPAVINLIISIIVALGKTDEALYFIESCLSSARSVSASRGLLEQAASLEQQRGNTKQAVKHLEQLGRICPDDITIQCRHIRALSEVDPKKAEQLSAQVFPYVSKDSVDIDELEESDWILYGDKYKKKEHKEVQDTEIVTGKLRARKRKRKVILPKNFDPSIQPDPERWLPKQERSTFKQKKNKKYRDRDIGRGTQGSTSHANVEYKMDSPSSPLAIPVEGPRQQRPANKPAKKKAKKGGKW